MKILSFLPLLVSLVVDQIFVCESEDVLHASRRITHVQRERVRRLTTTNIEMLWIFYNWKYELCFIDVFHYNYYYYDWNLDVPAEFTINKSIILQYIGHFC